MSNTHPSPEPPTHERAPTLSICIPTYNFGEFIAETLDSIRVQLTDDCEVLVVDGASTDDTQEVVGRYVAMDPRIRYVLLDARGGIDRDMATSVELARGRYCWLFSADDLMVEGAIEEMIRHIETGSDVYLCETVICSIDMKPRERRGVLDIREARTFELSDPDDRREYFRLSLNTQAFFSFCGAIVFRRERWMESTGGDAFIGTCWAHAARLVSLMPSGLRVTVVPQPLSLKRGDNDSFLDRGIAHRTRIGIDGYLRIASTFFADDPHSAEQIRRCLRAEYTPLYMLSAKAGCVGARDRDGARLLDGLFESIYASTGPRGERAILLFTRTPVIAWRIAYYLRPPSRLLFRLMTRWN